MLQSLLRDGWLTRHALRGIVRNQLGAAQPGPH